MNQRRDAGEVGRIDRVPLGLEILDDGLDVDGVPEGGVMSSSSMTSGKRPYRARWASPHKRVDIRRSPEYCEGISRSVETMTYRSHNISAKWTPFAIRFAALSSQVHEARLRARVHH